jgi:hypothetical protein
MTKRWYDIEHAKVSQKDFGLFAKNKINDAWSYDVLYPLKRLYENLFKDNDAAHTIIDCTDTQKLCSNKNLLKKVINNTYFLIDNCTKYSNKLDRFYISTPFFITTSPNLGESDYWIHFLIETGQNGNGNWVLDDAFNIMNYCKDFENSEEINTNFKGVTCQSMHRDPLDDVATWYITAAIKLT